MKMLRSEGGREGGARGRRSRREGKEEGRWDAGAAGEEEDNGWA